MKRMPTSRWVASGNGPLGSAGAGCVAWRSITAWMKSGRNSVSCANVRSTVAVSMPGEYWSSSASYGVQSSASALISAASVSRRRTSASSPVIPAKSDLGRASRQAISQATPALLRASTRSAGSAVACIQPRRISRRLAACQGLKSSSSAAAANKSAISVRHCNSWRSDTRAAICSARASAPPVGIITAASQCSMPVASPIAASRRYRVSSSI